MDSIEVSEGLTIGGAEPIGQDAIDKLQNQIIAPYQTIYVSNNGSDENAGTISYPVRTLDKAQELIKNGVTSITIILDNTTDNIEYTFNMQPFVSKNNTEITIKAKNYWSATENEDKKPILKPIFYKAPTTANNQFRMGYYVCMNFNTVEFENIHIKYPDNAVINTTFYNKYLIASTSSLTLIRCIVELISDAVILNSRNIETNKLTVQSSTIEGQEDNTNYFANAGYYNTTIDSDDPDNIEKWKQWGSSELAIFSFIKQTSSRIMNINTLTSNCVALYTNIN